MSVDQTKSTQPLSRFERQSERARPGGGAMSREPENVAPILADEIRMFAHAHGQWLPLDLARHLATHVVEPLLASIEARVRAEVAEVTTPSAVEGGSDV